MQRAGGPRASIASTVTAVEGCVFCRMLDPTNTEVEVVDATTLSVAVKPPRERVPGHLLFVATAHFTDVARYPRAGSTVFEHIGRYVRSNGIAADILTGISASPDRRAWHHYMHMIPRGPDDGLSASWPWPEEEK